MYKNNLVILVLLFAAFFGCTEKSSVSIKGSYPESAGRYLTLELLSVAETQFIDSIKVGSSGNFRFSFELKNPELVVLRNFAGKRISLLAYPEDKISVEIPSGDFATHYKVSGSEESQQIKNLVSRIEETRQRLDSLSAVYDELEDKDGPQADLLVSAYQQVLKEQKRHNIKYVIENISKLSSIYALYQRIAPDMYVLNDLRDLQYFKIVSDSVQVSFPESSLTQSLVADVTNRLKDYTNVVTLNRLSEKGVTEAGMINLNIEDTDGQEISLASLKGNVILVQFWASWSEESRDANRLLKSVYNNYHNRGFEVYAVALENDRNTWRSSIDFEEYDWINVSELSYPYSYAANVYNVSNLPANYLIDREGNIVAKNLYGRVLSTWLDNLL